MRAFLRRLGSTNALTVTEGADGIRVDLAGLGGAWVTIALTDASRAERNTSFVLTVPEPGSDQPPIPLEEEALGGGRFAWTGRLPEGAETLRIAPVFVTERPQIAAVGIRRRGRLALVLRGLARDRLLTAQAVWWRLLGKKVRSRAMLARAVMPQPETGYRAWLQRRKQPDRRAITREIASWTAPPIISILMPVHDPKPAVLNEAIRSVRRQLYPHWQLCLADDASRDPEVVRLLDLRSSFDPRIRLVRRRQGGHIARATNDALSLATGDWALFLDHDDVLPTDALLEIARAIAADPDLVLVYGDEDKIDAAGRRVEPHFKPDFDRELLLGQNYINHPTAIRMAELRALGGLRPGFEGSQDHDLLLRLVRGLDPARIRHVPKILYHWRAGDGSGSFSDRALAATEEARLRAVAEAVAPDGVAVKRAPLGHARLVRPLPDPAPRVSVVIPTRDRAELLETTLRGLLRKTDYPDIEPIVVDNGSTEPETAALFARLAAPPHAETLIEPGNSNRRHAEEGGISDSRIRILPSPGPFNFSALCNQGAAAATGAVLLFLNNDVEVIEEGWLRELVSIALVPDVGAVGAKLLYPDGTLQHGGVILRERSVAGHAHPGLGGEEPGYFGRAMQAREVSAVTAACLAIRRDLFAEIGGFDAARLAIAYNDVDLCLRLRAAGKRIVWTPFARLIHHESRSRGAEDTPEKRARLAEEAAVMKERWGAELAADPFYNPNFVPDSLDFRF